MKLYAQYLDSQTERGGWYVAGSPESATAAAKAAREEIPAQYRYLHELGGLIETTDKDVGWARSGGTPKPFDRDGRLHLVDLAVETVER